MKVKPITSREQAIEALGKLGADIWDSVREYDERTICGDDYVFDKRPPRLESLTDEGLEGAYVKARQQARVIPLTFAQLLRAVVTADREQERKILEQETEEEPLEKLRAISDGLVRSDGLREYVATVRAHDRAKGSQYAEPRPVSEWTEDMGRCFFGWFEDGRPIAWTCQWVPDERDTHFLPLPKEPK